MTDAIQVGPLEARPSEIATYFHTHLAEAPPPAVMIDVLDDDGNVIDSHECPVSCERFEAWAQAPEPIPVDPERVRAYLIGLGALIEKLETFEDIWSGEVEDAEAQDRIMFEFYEHAKATFGEDKSAIRDFFKFTYLLVNQTQNGSRWGLYVFLLGLDTFKDILRQRFESPFGLHQSVQLS